jgi:hypothetical protein
MWTSASEKMSKPFSQPGQGGSRDASPKTSVREQPLFALKYDDGNIMSGNGHQPPPRTDGEVTGRVNGQPPRDIPLGSVPGTTAPSRGWKFRRVLLLFAGLVVQAGGGLWFRAWWSVGRFLETTDDAFVGADITTISSKVPGFIARVEVADNQRVRAGDLLATIDDRDYRAELAKAEARVHEDEARMANLDASAELQAAMIEQARARTASTAAERRRAASDGIRAHNLMKRSVVSEQDFEQVDAPRDSKLKGPLPRRRRFWSSLV